MEKHLRFILIATIALLCGASHAFAQQIPEAAGYVVDQAGMISPAAGARVSRQLADFERKHSIRIDILTIPSLDGENMTIYGTNVLWSWGLGPKGVLLVAAKKEHRVSIFCSDELNDRLPVHRIVDSIVMPEFKAGRFDDGLGKGVTAIIEALSSRPILPFSFFGHGEPAGPRVRSHRVHNLLAILLGLSIAFILSFNARRKKEESTGQNNQFPSAGFALFASESLSGENDGKSSTGVKSRKTIRDYTFRLFINGWLRSAPEGTVVFRNREVDAEMQGRIRRVFGICVCLSTILSSYLLLNQSVRIGPRVSETEALFCFAGIFLLFFAVPYLAAMHICRDAQIYSGELVPMRPLSGDELLAYRLENPCYNRRTGTFGIIVEIVFCSLIVSLCVISSILIITECIQLGNSTHAYSLPYFLIFVIAPVWIVYRDVRTFRLKRRLERAVRQFPKDPYSGMVIALYIFIMISFAIIGFNILGISHHFY